MASAACAVCSLTEGGLARLDLGADAAVEGGVARLAPGIVVAIRLQLRRGLHSV